MDATVPTTGFLVIGVGFLGSQRAAAATIAKGARLAAVSDVDQAAARAVSARHGAVAAADVSAALELAEVDAVIVATPHAEHADLVRRALEAGKHVLCEKPLAIDADEACELAQLADDRGLRLATGFNHRFYPPIRDALALVDSGRIGRVTSVRAVIGHKASREFLDGWHGDPARSGGGTLMDNGPHACDLIRKFLGEVAAVKGYIQRKMDSSLECESEAFALFRARDCGIAELRSSWSLESGYLTLEVRGAQGWLRVETAPWRLSGTLNDGRRVGKSYPADRVAERIFRRRFGCERSLVRELEAFVSPERLPRQAATGWDGCRATETVRAVYRSADTGEEVLITPPRIELRSIAGRRDMAREQSRR